MIVEPVKRLNPLKSDKAAAAQVRVQSFKGDAIEYDCVACNEEADHWSYNAKDPNERVCPTTGRAYSVDPDFYVPLCARCHWRFDRTTDVDEVTVK